MIEFRDRCATNWSEQCMPRAFGGQVVRLPRKADQFQLFHFKIRARLADSFARKLRVKGRQWKCRTAQTVPQPSLCAIRISALQLWKWIHRKHSAEGPSARERSENQSQN